MQLGQDDGAPGAVALVSQSATGDDHRCSTTLDSGLRLSSVIATGAESDVSLAEISITSP